VYIDPSTSIYIAINFPKVFTPRASQQSLSDKTCLYGSSWSGRRRGKFIHQLRFYGEVNFAKVYCFGSKVEINRRWVLIDLNQLSRSCTRRWSQQHRLDEHEPGVKSTGSQEMDCCLQVELVRVSDVQGLATRLAGPERSGARNSATRSDGVVCGQGNARRKSTVDGPPSTARRSGFIPRVIGESAIDGLPVCGWSGRIAGLPVCERTREDSRLTCVRENAGG
jgi:hypothetical protein